MEFQINLKKLMESRNITMSELSRQTNIPKQTIHNWLCGSQPKDVKRLLKLSNFFNVSIESLFANTKFD